MSNFWEFDNFSRNIALVTADKEEISYQKLLEISNDIFLPIKKKK